MAINLDTYWTDRRAPPQVMSISDDGVLITIHNKTIERNTVLQSTVLQSIKQILNVTTKIGEDLVTMFDIFQPDFLNKSPGCLLRTKEAFCLRWLWTLCDLVEKPLGEVQQARQRMRQLGWNESNDDVIEGLEKCKHVVKVAHEQYKNACASVRVGSWLPPQLKEEIPSLGLTELLIELYFRKGLEIDHGAKLKYCIWPHRLQSELWTAVTDLQGIRRSVLDEIVRKIGGIYAELTKLHRPCTTFLCFLCGSLGATRSRIPKSDVRSVLLDRMRMDRIPEDLRADAERRTRLLKARQSQTAEEETNDDINLDGARDLKGHHGQAFDGNFQPRSACVTCKVVRRYTPVDQHTGEDNRSFEWMACAEFVASAQCQWMEKHVLGMTAHAPPTDQDDLISAREFLNDVNKAVEWRKGQDRKSESEAMVSYRTN